MRKLVNYFSRNEKILWCSSVLAIFLSFCIFDRENYLTLMASLVGVTMPMAIFALISWLRNPYNGSKAEVRVNNIGRNEIILMWVMTIIVTVVFYYILKRCGTANIVPSTLSVTTSFLAVYLTFRRSTYFAVAYASNDVVLILLWILASVEDIRYISVVVCFAAFLVNDIYGFLSWREMERRQSDDKTVVLNCEIADGKMG